MESSSSSVDRKKVKKKTVKKEGTKTKSSDASSVSTTRRKTSRKSARNFVDDDEFSVAPSMDQDVKSVVTASFDDVYARGRKVRYATKERNCVVWIAVDNRLGKLPLFYSIYGLDWIGLN
jgi:hypothetical protein